MADMTGFRVDDRDGVTTLTFCRPGVGNTITAEMVGLLTTFLKRAKEDSSIRCLIVTGEGRHFCTGGDVSSFAQTLSATPAERRASYDSRLVAAAALVEALLDFDRPIIAAARGAVAGAGLMFTLAADFVLADETVTFNFSHQRLGLPPDGGVSWLLPRIVGWRAATRLILTGARIEAAESEALGLVTQRTPSADLEAQAQAQAHRFANGPQAALRHAKALLYQAGRVSLSEQLEAERQAVVACVGTSDFIEGVLAFTEKRPAVFPSSEPPNAEK